MQSELDVITAALTAARTRLDAHVRTLETGSTSHAALMLARDRVAAALAALDQAARAVTPRPPEPTLLDQIVLLKPAPTDAFRTKIKLKAAEPPTAVVLSVVTDGHDDLTRIRGIDVGTAQLLAGLGIVTFDAIAGWVQADVQRVSDALNLGRTISRQNWIEQAALLRRAQPGPSPAVQPQRDPEPVAVQPMVAVVEIAPVLVEAVMRPVHADPLRLIVGLSTSHQALLRSGGVRRWADIASWRRADIAQWQATLGVDAPITKAGWIEQAALLATGGTTRFATRQMRGVSSSVVALPTVEALPPPVFAPWAVEPRAPELQFPLEPAPPVPVAAVEQVPGDMPKLIELPEETATVPPVHIVPLLEVPDFDLPTAVDRVAALELELAALVANDTAARVSQKPEMKFEAVQRTTPAPFNIEDEEFQELNVSEADVVIVPRNKPGTVAASKVTDTVSTRTLLARMRRVPPIDDIEADRYSAYRERAEEASVEIIRGDGPRAERVSADSGALPTPHEPPIKRLLRSLKRQD